MTAQDAFETVIDILEAPGRHVTEWDGCWTNDVAVAVIERIKEIAECERVSMTHAD